MSSHRAPILESVQEGPEPESQEQCTDVLLPALSVNPESVQECDEPESQDLPSGPSGLLCARSSELHAKQKVARLLMEAAPRNCDLSFEDVDPATPIPILSQCLRPMLTKSIEEVESQTLEMYQKLDREMNNKVPQTPTNLRDLCPRHCWYPKSMHELAESQALSVAVFSCVVLNGIQMGVQEDYHGGSADTIYLALDNIFTCVFVIEMLIKVYAFRMDYFRDKWNCADFVLSWMSIIDVWIISPMTDGSGGMKIFSVFRMLRMLRLVRIFRMLRSFQELVLIVNGFFDACKTCAWVCLLLLSVMYIFSIFCTQMIGRASDVYEGYSENEFDGESDFNPYLYFGTIPRAIYTLLNLVFLTEDWDNIAHALLERQPGMLMLLLLFVIFNSLGLLNVILGVVVESVMDATNDEKADEDMKKRKALIVRLKDLYNFVFSLDLDGDFAVSANELRQAWDQDEMKELLAIVDLPLGSEAEDLVSLIDTDGDGKLEIDEVVKNLVRLLTSDKKQQTMELKAQMGRVLREVKLLRKNLEEQSSMAPVSSPKASSGIDQIKVCKELQAVREEQKNTLLEIKALWSEVPGKSNHRYADFAHQLKVFEESENAREARAATRIQRSWRTKTKTREWWDKPSPLKMAPLQEAMQWAQDGMTEEPEAEGNIFDAVKETAAAVRSSAYNVIGELKKDQSVSKVKEMANSQLRSLASKISTPAEFFSIFKKPKSFKELAQSPILTTAVFTCISLNAIQMGIATDHNTAGTRAVFWWFDNIFTLLFAIEMVLKICAGPAAYFKQGWNVFDFFLSWLSIIDVWILSNMAGGNSGFKIFSVLRTLRMLRAIRLLRMLRQFRQLALIVLGFIKAMKTTAWVCFLLLFVMYIFSIFCTKLIAKSGIYEGYSEEGDVYEDAAEFNPYQYFGTIPRSMFTLLNFAFLTGYWDIVCRAVLERQPVLLWFFIAFVAFTNLGLLNVIVGIVCESVTSSIAVLKEDKESLRKAQLLKRLQMLYHFVFSLDTDDDMRISTQELKESWTMPEMREICSMMHLPLGADAADLVDVLDINGDGALEHEELVKGMVRMLTNSQYQQMLELKVGLNRIIREVKVSNAMMARNDQSEEEEDEVAQQLREVQTQQGVIKMVVQHMRADLGKGHDGSSIKAGTPIGELDERTESSKALSNYEHLGADVPQPLLLKSLGIGSPRPCNLPALKTKQQQETAQKAQKEWDALVAKESPALPIKLTPASLDNLLATTGTLDSARSTKSHLFGGWKDTPRSRAAL